MDFINSLDEHSELIKRTDAGYCDTETILCSSNVNLAQEQPSQMFIESRASLESEAILQQIELDISVESTKSVTKTIELEGRSESSDAPKTPTKMDFNYSFNEPSELIKRTDAGYYDTESNSCSSNVNLAQEQPSQMFIENRASIYIRDFIRDFNYSVNEPSELANRTDAEYCATETVSVGPNAQEQSSSMLHGLKSVLLSEGQGMDVDTRLVKYSLISQDLHGSNVLKQEQTNIFSPFNSPYQPSASYAAGSGQVPFSDPTLSSEYENQADSVMTEMQETTEPIPISQNLKPWGTLFAGNHNSTLYTYSVNEPCNSWDIKNVVPIYYYAKPTENLRTELRNIIIQNEQSGPTQNFIYYPEVLASQIVITDAGFRGFENNANDFCSSNIYLVQEQPSLNIGENLNVQSSLLPQNQVVGYWSILPEKHSINPQDSFEGTPVWAPLKEPYHGQHFSASTFNTDHTIQSFSERIMGKNKSAGQNPGGHLEFQTGLAVPFQFTPHTLTQQYSDSRLIPNSLAPHTSTQIHSDSQFIPNSLRNAGYDENNFSPVFSRAEGNAFPQNIPSKEIGSASEKEDLSWRQARIESVKKQFPEIVGLLTGQGSKERGASEKEGQSCEQQAQGEGVKKDFPQ